MRKSLKWSVLVVVALVVLGVGGPWVYINLIRDDAPDRLSLTSTTVGSGGQVQPADVEGVWTATGDSVVGYRVKEILFGQSTEGVGRTNQIDGTLTITGGTLLEAGFTVDMASITSDDGRRDGQFRGSIMSTDTYPTAVFALREPIQIPESARTGEVLFTKAVGELTLRGETKQVEFTLEARLSGTVIEVVGSITIVFSEWNIPNPSRPAITTEDEGELEFRLLFAKA
jgi:polyisoprenoid-binding protein YceI